MKKHAFKRITAMVLVFVMCVFLMPTNSLGVRAVTADDVLVEESQVSSEIGAENPASEVEVITSEEAETDIIEEITSDVAEEELPSEEFTSEELSSEELSSEELIPKETEEEYLDLEELISEEIVEDMSVEEPDVLSEEGTMVLADASTDVVSLYALNSQESLGTYSKWSAAIAEINRRADAEEIYVIHLLDDIKISGKLTMPASNKCYGVLVRSSGQVRTLTFTGDMTVPVQVVFEENVKLQPVTSSGVPTRCKLTLTHALACVQMYEDNSAFSSISGKGMVSSAFGAHVDVSGTIDVGYLYVSSESIFEINGNAKIRETRMFSNSTVICHNNLTITDMLSASGHNPQIWLKDGKTAAIKESDLHGMFYGGEPVKFKIRLFAGDDNFITPDVGRTVVTATGTLNNHQITVLDAAGNDMGIYRSGNELKVKGDTKTPYTLIETTNGYDEDLGSYATLQDAMTEISRIKNKEGEYTINVTEAAFCNGAFPMPTAGTYSKLTFEGESITFTGSFILTGTVHIENELIRVTSATDSTIENININLSKYKLVLGYGKTMTNIGNITGTKGSVLLIKSHSEMEVFGNIKDVDTLYITGTLKAWGNISVNKIATETSEIGNLYCNVEKNFTIKGEAALGAAYLYICSNGEVVSAYTEGMTIVDSASKTYATTFVLPMGTDYTLYKDGSTIKVGKSSIYVYMNPSDDWTTTRIIGRQFKTINDAIDYICYYESTSPIIYAIRLNQDIPSGGTIKTISGENKTILIKSKDNADYTLNFTGTFVADGCNIEIENVNLCNSATSNASVTLKNGATITLCNTAINAITAPSGTAVTIANGEDKEVDVTINGTAKCLGDFTIEDGAGLWCKGALTTGSFTLDGEHAEICILAGKAFTINGAVNIGEDSIVGINFVDKDGNLASVKGGATMVTATKATASQFYTENVMTGTTDVCWQLTKSGKVIKTAALVACVYDLDDEVEEGSFASFNEAKEYVAAQEDGNEYAIELLCDTSGADLSDIPDNLTVIARSLKSTATSVKLTTIKDINLSTDLELYAVNLVASKKTIFANEFELIVNGGSITAARAKELSCISIDNGTVTFTAKDSTINYVDLGAGGTLKCPQFAGFAQG